MIFALEVTPPLYKLFTAEHRYKGAKCHWLSSPPGRYTGGGDGALAAGREVPRDRGGDARNVRAGGGARAGRGRSAGADDGEALAAAAAARGRVAEGFWFRSARSDPSRYPCYPRQRRRRPPASNGCSCCALHRFLLASTPRHAGGGRKSRLHRRQYQSSAAPHVCRQQCGAAARSHTNADDAVTSA